uniref:Uncharacterized protein n=1 Tax=Panagrolaimus davidi TaxID=227884 RepID=A0A914Q7U1_9BILA
MSFQLIQKVKNLCSSESRILRDIVNMRKQLSDRLTSVSNFNVKIQDASVHIVGYLSQIERQVDNLGTQNWENKKHLETLEDNLYVAASRSVWVQESSELTLALLLRGGG